MDGDPGWKTCPTSGMQQYLHDLRPQVFRVTRRWTGSEGSMGGGYDIQVSSHRYLARHMNIFHLGQILLKSGLSHLSFPSFFGFRDIFYISTLAARRSDKTSRVLN